MTKLNFLKAALIAGASVAAIATAATAAEFNIPAGDLKTALDAYSAQTGVALIVSDDAIRGARTNGAKGDFTALAALNRILDGTGLAPHRTPYGAVAVVHDENQAKPVQLSRLNTLRLAEVIPEHAAAAVETVVVTSSKIKGDIQTVPIAITALSQEQLTSRQIAGGPDLVKEVPNLTFSKTNFSGYNLEIRGIGTQAISVTTDPAVAVAFNDTPFIRNHFFEQEFFDVSQVEVLRGPQGTLYGRNATAGVVNVVSAKPTDQFEAMLSADWGNYHNRRYEGMMNVPIVGDRLALRVAGEWTKRDGYSFNDTTGRPIDGRDLWSARATLGWKPVSSVQTYLIWEHFSENDDRLRSGKQLCKTDPGPSTFTDWNGNTVPVPAGSFLTGAIADPFAVTRTNFDQSCIPTSLYSKDAFGVPFGPSLPFVSGAAFLGLLNEDVDPYAQTTQSTNLRHIQSAIEPTYKAKNDTLEFNASWTAAPWLTLHSQTGYNNDFLWSSEDFNRFDTSPGIFNVNSGMQSFQRVFNANGEFCDPQLGCSNRLVLQDLVVEHAWQLSQEFRAESDFKGPFNFSVGGNYLHYETGENYYVFSNTFTLISLDNCGYVTYVPGVTTHEQCITGRNYYKTLNALFGGGSQPTGDPQYIDPNPITRLNTEGHNYFVSQNPYVLNSYAMFGEAYYNLTPDLKLTGGLRWTDDQKHFPEIPSELLTIGYGYPSTGAVDQGWHEWTGRFVANWTPKLDFTDQTMIYASYAHGYKAGGANPPGPGLLAADIGNSQGENIGFPVHPLTFKPEFIDAYEMGTKNTMLDGAVTLNGDVFFYNYKAYQISQIVDRSSINLNFDATVKGAELEATYEPLPGLKFSFAGGYEDTNINKNQYAIDLMDRTAGHPGFTVMKPSVGESSNCVIPQYVGVALLQEQVLGGFGEGNPEVAACGYAYGAHVDPVTELPYVLNPTVNASAGQPPLPAGYPGFDPLSVDPSAPANVNNGLGLLPNNGEGFAKPVGGNELPNAPHFTVSLTGDYTMPVSANWAATLHADFYWQSQSFARVFNDRPYDKIRGYSNVNTALILTDASGWQVMGYVKNIFNVTAITGDFLNSDDSGLTTNIFLTDPRLYGVRVTKHFDGPDGGFNLFSGGDGKKPQIWLTFGGDFAQLADGWQKFNPPFASIMPTGLPNPVAAEKTPRTSFDWEGKLSYQPEDSDWVLKAGIRYGRSGNKQHLHKSLPPKTAKNIYIGGKYMSCDAFMTLLGQNPATRCPFKAFNQEFVDSQASSSERHAILDFTLGKDIGIGTIGGGVRIAQFDTKARAELNSNPHYNFPSPVNPLNAKYGGKYSNVYDATTQEKRSFDGIGPELTWDASQAILGNEGDGQVSIDWGLNGAVLFGRQSATLHQSMYHKHCPAGSIGTCNPPGYARYGGYGVVISNPPPKTIRRSRNVTVPNLGGYIGASVRYQNAKISLGYRADEFFNAMDGGQATAKSYNRGFYGPYASISIGLGD
jgi:iron complex outermembrane receptor protein